MAAIQDNKAMSDEGMATDKTSTSGEKAAAEHLDRKPSLLVDEVETEKNLPAMRKVDYSGAYEKTDPKEIALVKKLDRWIMVCLLIAQNVGELQLGGKEEQKTNKKHLRSLCSGACTGSTIWTGMLLLWRV